MIQPIKVTSRIHGQEYLLIPYATSPQNPFSEAIAKVLVKKGNQIFDEILKAGAKVIEKEWKRRNRRNKKANQRKR